MQTEKVTPFTFVSALTSKENIIAANNSLESKYVPFVVNRHLSYFRDTILWANEVNKYHDALDNRLQFEFYLNTISAKPRFTKWAKENTDEKINIVSEYYNVSKKKGEQLLRVLNDEQLETIKRRLERGGNE